MKIAALAFAASLSALVAVSPVDHACAQATATAAPVNLERGQAKAALAALDKALGDYVFPEAADRARSLLRTRQQTYLAIRDRDELAATLTEDIGAALQDAHFYVRAPSRPTPVPGASNDAVEAAEAYGVAAVRRMPGNIGYLNLTRFGVSANASARVEAAMDILADTQALIIDLRENRGGGDPAMSALIGRLAATPIPRSIFIWRQDGGFIRAEAEVRDYPLDKRFGRPVVILTSKRTISAAEAFAYDLQAAGRAKVVGEVTRGGANPMNRPLFDLGSGLSAYIATGRTENPLTKGTPNGRGVTPDVETAAADALAVAYSQLMASLDQGA